MDIRQQLRKHGEIGAKDLREVVGDVLQILHRPLLSDQQAQFVEHGDHFQERSLFGNVVKFVREDVSFRYVHPSGQTIDQPTLAGARKSTDELREIGSIGEKIGFCVVLKPKTVTYKSFALSSRDPTEGVRDQ